MEEQNDVICGHPPVLHGRVGVLLANLGTPDALDYFSLRRFLKEFLSDRRVIEMNRLLWWVLLNAVILVRRPWSAGRAYAEIWDHEANESPLRGWTRSQAQKLTERLSRYENVRVDWGMRYGTPSIGAVMERLQSEGCDRILFFPLYPQYCAATTGTAVDTMCGFLTDVRWQPTVRVVPPFYDNPVYVEALAATVRTAMEKADFDPERIIVSFHGVPVSFLQKGDPYYCHCMKTTRLLRENLCLDAGVVVPAFQSRFGRAEWLRPYTDEIIKDLALSGVKKVMVVAPSFFSDCVETLEELGVQNQQLFQEHGGKDFLVVPCLNDSEAGMKVMEHLVLRELSGWL